MKTHFILTTLILMSISISAQNYKEVPYDYDPTEEKNIGIETTYDFSDSMKLVIVTITNKSKKDIRVFNKDAFLVNYLNADGEHVTFRFFPFGWEPEVNQMIILKPGASETFGNYCVYDSRKGGYNSFPPNYDKTKGPIRKIRIEYYVTYRFMDEKDPRKLLHLRKVMEPVSLF